MSRMVPRRAARKDDSQAAIVKALRAAGAAVDDIGYPVDLLVSYRGQWFLMDCKTDRIDHNGAGYAFKRRGKRTKDQEDFAKRHSAPVYFPATPFEAVAVVRGPTVAQTPPWLEPTSHAVQPPPGPATDGSAGGRLLKPELRCKGCGSPSSSGICDECRAFGEG